MNLSIFACLYVAALANAAYAAPPAMLRDGVLVDPQGRTLYTFDVDAPNQSHCNRICQQVWLPLPVAADGVAQAKFTIVAREDGTRQWAYEEKPLYWYVADRYPGDMRADNLGGAWHTVHEPSFLADHSRSDAGHPRAGGAPISEKEAR